MYSVKFVCIPFVGLDKEAFVPQNYSTVVNVHNNENLSALQSIRIILFVAVLSQKNRFS
jgi:hypothetical protein